MPRTASTVEDRVKVGEWRKAVGGLELKAVLCNRLLRRRGGDWNRFGKVMEEDLEEEEEEDLEEEEEEEEQRQETRNTQQLGPWVQVL